MRLILWISCREQYESSSLAVNKGDPVLLYILNLVMASDLVDFVQSMNEYEYLSCLCCCDIQCSRFLLVSLVIFIPLLIRVHSFVLI